MGVSLKSTMACNLSCKYCYENSIRNAGNAKSAFSYDKEAMTESLIYQLMNNDPDHGGLILHGGEPLLMPIEDLEHFLKISYEIAGKSCIQTNGELITDEIIELLVKYKCGIGISFDGLDELNMGRWKHSEEGTMKATSKTWENIKKLKSQGISVGTITVINRNNGLRSQREDFKKFLLALKEIEISSGRLNPANVDGDLQKDLELTPEELADFWTDIAKFCYDHGLEYNPITDVQDSLMNLSVGTCIFMKCDPFHTTAEQGIQSDGTMGNCLMPAKEGIIFLQDEYGENFDRYEILKSIPKEEGGCGGCRYWNICTGICPGEGVDNDGEFDVRGKSRFCESFYALYETVEDRLRRNTPNIILQTDINSGVGVDDFIVAPTLTFENMVANLKTHGYRPEIDIEEKLKTGQAITYTDMKARALMQEFMKKNPMTEDEMKPIKLDLDEDLLNRLKNGEVIQLPVMGETYDE